MTALHPQRRIAILSVHTSPLAALGGKKTGGMNVYIREVARFMSQLGVVVDVFTREDRPAAHNLIEPIAENARLIYLPAGPSQFLDSSAIYPYLPEFREALFNFVRTEQQHYDIVFSHYWLSGWVAMALRKAFGFPFVQMFHTLGRMKDRIADMELPTADAQITLQQSNMRVIVEQEIIKRADGLIAATPAERLQLLWLYRADRRRIQIVSPGVDLSHFQPMQDRAAARIAVGLPSEQRMLLFVGRIEPLKGIDTILRALDIVRDMYPETLKLLKLIIVGGDLSDPPPEIIRLKEMCEKLGLDAYIDFVGARSHEQLPTFYNAAEALIMPSDYESFGMVALESMACGTPVIASEVGGLAFLIRDFETGLHVPVRDPQALAERIYTLLANPHERDQMGQRARQAAEAYGWPDIVTQLLEIFDTLDVATTHLQ